MKIEEFETLITQVTADMGDRALDASLMEHLNSSFPADGEHFGEIQRACHEAIADGWMCNREAGGVRFGRVLKPSEVTHGFSVDVVQMKDIKGPHHRHPAGEIDMIMPINPGACFDGHGASWLVYPPDSAHYPTVTGGEALVLYLLPDGQIEFTR